jgi:membrane protease YdiL (CAAX protease family)
MIERDEEVSRIENDWQEKMVTVKINNKRSLIAYLIILVILCTSFVIGAMILGEQGAYLAQGYMLTPALAAILTRLFFYPLRFIDANLRFGRTRDYLKYWIYGLGITALSYGIYTLLGAVHWDFSGQVFLERLAEQFAATGQDISDTLPPGFTPQIMLWVFFISGLTVFNILPGLITGFGEEFGHRGFMFPVLYRIKPWMGFIIGGLLWFVWHIPISFMIPQAVEVPLWTSILNYLILAVGSVCTFAYLAYVYVKSGSIFVTSIAHIAMNNAGISLGYFVIIKDQTLANLGLTLTMLIVATIMVSRKLLVFDELSDTDTIR